MRIPKTNKVHYRTYDIKQEKQPMVEGSPCDGWMDKDVAEICVKKGLQLLPTKDVLLHEVLHAIFYEHGLETDMEEKLVRTIASALIQNIEDNAGFWRFICRKS